MSYKQNHILHDKKVIKKAFNKAKQEYHNKLLEAKLIYQQAKNNNKTKKQTQSLDAIKNNYKRDKLQAKKWLNDQKMVILKENTFSLDKQQYDLKIAKNVLDIKNIFARNFRYLVLTSSQKSIYHDFVKTRNQQLSKKKKNYDKANVFEADNFNFFYGQTQALFDINIKIPRKKVTAFIGPSGCGKSTFLRCLNRTNTGDVSFNGNIYFDDGTNIMSKHLKPLSLRTRVGMIFQKPSPFPMSIYDNIAYGPRSHGILNKNLLDNIVKESLQSAALWDEVKDKLFTSATALSGGQQQRLCIARAIALKPEVLLMDESTSGLDPIATAKIENLINVLKKDYTIILVSHSMAQVQRIADFTAFFYNGHLVEYGPTRNIFINPKNKRTKDYIAGKIG